MSNILHFPTPQAQGLAYLDRELRQILADRGADPGLTDYAAEQLTAIYAEHADEETATVSLRLPTDLNQEQVDLITGEVGQALDHMRAENHRVILRLIAELVLAQLRIYSHEQGD